MNPLRRLLNLFRRKPVMVGAPPSARQVPADLGWHAVDFSVRYFEPINYQVENRMTKLGIDPLKIGWADRRNGTRHAAFHPRGREGGNNAPDGRLIVDSGVFNLELLQADYGPEAARLFARSTVRDRLDSIIAHEYEEHRHGMSHVAELEHTPKTELPIGDRARAIAAAMRQGWRAG